MPASPPLLGRGEELRVTTSRLHGFLASGNKLRPSSMVSVGNFGLDFQTSVVRADPGNTACSSRRLPVCIKEQPCEGFVGCRVLYEVHSDCDECVSRMRDRAGVEPRSEHHLPSDVPRVEPGLSGSWWGGGDSSALLPIVSCRKCSVRGNPGGCWSSVFL